MNKISNLALCAVLVCTHCTANAQQPLFQEENFPAQVEEIKHVSGIAADNNNCIWFTTQTGIYRYDGSRFRHYSVSNTPVLKFERMASISVIEGKKGFRWIIKDSKGTRYEIDDESRIQPFKLKEGEDEVYVHNRLGIPFLLPESEYANQSPFQQIVESFTVRRSGSVYYITDDARLEYVPFSDQRSGKSRKTIYRFSSNDYKVNFSSIFLLPRAVYVIDKSGIIAWEKDEARTNIKLTGDILSHGSINYPELLCFPSNAAGFCFFLYKNDVYEATENDAGGIHTRLLAVLKTAEIPTQFFYSQKQQLFICYYTSRGLVFFRPRQFRLLAFDDKGRNAEDYYYSIIPFKDGCYTINNTGLINLSLNGNHKLLVEGHLSKYFLFRNNNGDIWFEKNWRIGCLKFKNAQITMISDPVFPGLSDVLQENDSTYYVLQEGSLNECVMRNGKIFNRNRLYRSDPNIGLNFLYPVSDRKIWIGTDRGLLELDKTTRLILWVPEMKNTYLRSACKIAENNFILGSYDKGMFQFQNGKWIHLESKKRQLPSSAHAFIIDKGTSSLWVSSNQGIFRMPLSELLKNGSKENISFRHFTKFGPDIPAEFNGSSNISGAIISDTTFAFTNANGIVVFNPRRLLLFPLPVKVLVEPVNATDSLPDKAIHAQRIEFMPIVPYYGDLHELEVEYLLTNADKDWHSLTPNSVISYNNVRPGSHDLKFMIRHPHASDQKELALTATSFYVPYKWYQTNWFKALTFILIAAIVIGIHNFRIWYLRKRKKELEEMVLNKTHELKETNTNLVDVIDELSKSEYSLRQSNFLKDEYYAVLTHDLRSPLKFLAFHLRHMLERYPGINEQELKQGLAVANQTSYDIHKLIDEFAYWIQENEQQLVAQPAPTMINAVIADAKKIYQYSMEENKNQFITEADPELSFITDPKLLFIIIRNAIDNANKYCRNGGITVNAKRKGDQLEISVTDTGRGISDEMVRHLSSLQFENVQLSYMQRKSLGFYIMAILTKKLGGTYSIISEKDKGTRLKFVFPELNLHHEDPHR